MITIEQAQVSQASDIARLIMEAMNHECCLYFAGEEHGLSGFHQLVSDLVCRADSQYSYLNTLVALNAQRDVVGVCTAYDGARLHQLRVAFVQGCLARFSRDFGNMDDETAAGELYVDSLAVDAHYRGKGIAKALLRATVQRAKLLQLPAVGLLVDKGNPKAEGYTPVLVFNMWMITNGEGMPWWHLQYVFRVE